MTKDKKGEAGKKGTASNSEKKKSILIVDDMELNRKILSVILESRYHILEAENGLKAREVLKASREKVALILLDIVMPGMDGFAFLKYMQATEKYGKIPVIFVTSETYEENVLEGIKMGVRDVIAKPFHPELVQRRVDNLIKLSEQPEETVEAAVAEAAEEETVPASGIVPHTALIVDDIGINRVIIRNSLEESYDMLEASNGKEALELLEEHREEIAVVLLDIIMPVMDGYTFMREAKEQKLLRGIPVIAITSEDSPPKLDSLMSLGICEIIQKPFTPAVVKNRVEYMVKLMMNKR